MLNPPPNNSIVGLIDTLRDYWRDHACIDLLPHDLPLGAGTLHPQLIHEVVCGSNSLRVMYPQPCRRPDDAVNPDARLTGMRLYRHHQFQVVVSDKSLEEMRQLYLRSLDAIGISPSTHDLQFCEDDWKCPAIASWGNGWEVRCNQAEITQITLFQEVMGHPLRGNYPVEITYGLERLAMQVPPSTPSGQGYPANVYSVQWDNQKRCHELFIDTEVEYSKVKQVHALHYKELKAGFQVCLQRARLLLKEKLYTPAYEELLQAVHLFNILDNAVALTPKLRSGFIKDTSDFCREWAGSILFPSGITPKPISGE